MTEKQLNSVYPVLGRLPYADLCRWHDWLRSVPGAPDDLIRLTGMALGWSHLRSHVDET